MISGKNLYRRLKNLGLKSRDALTLRDLVFNKVKHHGIIGAIDILKRHKESLLRFYDATIAKPEWVQTFKGYPKALLFLQKYPLEIQIRVAHCYKCLTVDVVPAQAASKFLDAVTRPNTDFEEMWAYIKIGCPPQLSVNPRYPLVTEVFKSNDSTSGPGVCTKEPPIKESLDILSNTIFAGLPDIGSMFYPLIDVELPFAAACPLDYGLVSSKFEGGAKVRFYSNPKTAYQLALKPLHDALFHMLSQFPNSCALDQYKGVQWALDLGDTVPIHSVDLSSATDLFPFGVQKRLLEFMGVESVWIDCLEAVCKGRYTFSSSLRASFPFEFIQWKRGQPLGITPSMSLFSLTHLLLLRGIAISLGMNPDDSFRMLGDDVMMLAQMSPIYIGIMTRAGCSISMSKSRFGSLREFAGYTIFGKIAIRSGQFKEATIENSIGISSSLQVVLASETSRMLNTIQKVIGFVRGWYEPSVSDRPRFIRYATEILLKPLRFEKLPKKLFWVAIKEYVAKYRLPYFVEPVVLSPLSCAECLPEAHRLGFIQGYYVTSVRFDTGPAGIYRYLHNACIELLPEMGQEAVIDALACLRAKVLRVLYAPPRDLSLDSIESKGETSYAKSLISMVLNHSHSVT